MPDIFLSYSREDQATARRFAEAFQAEGLDVWWDTALRSGEAYDEVTESALRSAKAVVVLWSGRSVSSRWVRSEATLAERNRTLIPAMIEPCERPIMFELTQTAELSHWDGGTNDVAWRAFLADVIRHVGKDTLAHGPAARPAGMAAAPASPNESGEPPSLAVLPFSSRSNLPEDEAFAADLMEDVISALAQSVNLRVLGAFATAGLRKAAVTDLNAVGRQLGVRYLLEGSVRRVGDNLRISVNLLEVATAEILWSAQFDRPVSELAALHDELVIEVAANLDVQVQTFEMQRALAKPHRLTAWEAGMRSLSAYRSAEVEGMRRAIEEAARAVEIAPALGAAHAMLALATSAYYINISPDDVDEIESIRGIVDRALELGPDDAAVLSLIGCALCFIGDAKAGQRHTSRSVGMAPGGITHQAHGVACALLNRSETALEHFAKAVKLLPGSHLLSGIHAWRANALIRAQRWDEAESALDQSIELNPNVVSVYLSRAILCRRTGREAEAQRLASTAVEDGWSSAQVKLMFRRYYVGSSVVEELIEHIDRLWEGSPASAA